MLSKICPKRPLQYIQCAFVYVILYNTLNNGCYLISAILGDSCHIIYFPNSGWRGIFESFFSSVSPHLQIIVNHNWGDIDSAFVATKKELGDNLSLIKDIYRTTSQKSMYDKYIMKHIKDSLERHAIRHIEQNHASYCAIIGSKSVDYFSTEMKEIM